LARIGGHFLGKIAARVPRPGVAAVPLGVPLCEVVGLGGVEAPGALGRLAAARVAALPILHVDGLASRIEARPTPPNGQADLPVGHVDPVHTALARLDKAAGRLDVEIRDVPAVARAEQQRARPEPQHDPLVAPLVVGDVFELAAAVEPYDASVGELE